MLVQESKKELKKHERELNKIISKLEKDFNSNTSIAEKNHVQIAHKTLLKIYDEILFISKSKFIYINSTHFRQNVIAKIDKIGLLARKIHDIADELNHNNSIVNEALVISDFIVIDLAFAICSFIIESEYERQTRGELECIELTLALLEFYNHLSFKLEENFVLLIQNNYYRYIYFPVLIAEKIFKFKNKLYQDSSFFAVDLEKVKILNRLSICKKRTCNFIKKIMDCLKEIDNSADILITLENISLNQYESTSYILEDVSWCRVSYLNKILQLMSPSRNHEEIYRNIDILLIEYCDYKEIDYFPMGSSTIKKKSVAKEPDSSYAIGENKEIPDLAIEVNFTSGGIEDLKKYFILGVKEVWMWNKKTGLSFYLLKDKQYKECKESEILPGLRSEIIQKYLLKLSSGNHRILKKKFIAEASQDTP